jgi:hypothetical protein
LLSHDDASQCLEVRRKAPQRWIADEVMHAPYRLAFAPQRANASAHVVIALDQAGA